MTPPFPVACVCFWVTTRTTESLLFGAFLLFLFSVIHVERMSPSTPGQSLHPGTRLQMVTQSADFSRAVTHAYWDPLGAGTSSWDTDKCNKMTPGSPIFENKSRGIWFYREEVIFSSDAHPKKLSCHGENRKVTRHSVISGPVKPLPTLAGAVLARVASGGSADD